MTNRIEADAEDRVAVLGAGVCGLYTALELASAGVPVTIIERETTPGGLAAGFKRGDNYYDLGVHMLHGFDKEILRRIKDLMGDESIPVELNAKIRWFGKEFRYPLQFRDMACSVPPLELVRCVLGLLVAEAGNRLKNTDPANAEEALIQLYGRPLYEFFFKEFTHRYWDTHPAQLSSAFVKTKMPRLVIKDAVVSALRKVGLGNSADSGVPSALVSETLHYSRNGAEAMPRVLANAIREAGGEVMLGCSVTRLERPGVMDRILVSFEDQKGRQFERDASYCVSTLPLPRLIEMLDPVPPRVVRHAAGELGYRSIVIYGLLVRKQQALDALYVYFRNRMFHRIGEPKNAGMKTCPSDHTVLIVEMTCSAGDGRWEGDEDTRKQLASELEEEGVCTPDQIVEQHILRCAEGYPIFSLGFERHLRTVTEYLESLGAIRSTGRQGAFCYPNMHGAMRMGADAAGCVYPIRRKRILQRE